LSRYYEAWPTAGPTWLVDAQGRVLGFRDRLGNDYQLAMQAVPAGAESVAVGTILPPGGGGTLFTTVASGVVPASGGGTSNFMRADGAWAAPPVGPTYSAFSSSVAGLAPPSGGGNTNYLRADGSWQPPPGTTYSNFAGATPGLVPTSDGSTAKYLRGDGTFAVPPDTGATTVAALTDKATVDLPTVNTPLATVLASHLTSINAKPNLQGGTLTSDSATAASPAAVITYVQAQISAISGGNGTPVTTAFSTTIALDKIEGREMGLQVQTTNYTFVPAGSPAPVVNGSLAVTIQGDNTHTIDITAWNNPFGFSFDNTRYNQLTFARRPDGNYVYGALGATVPAPAAPAPVLVSATVASATPGQIEVLFDSDFDQAQVASGFFSHFAVNAGHTLTSSAWGNTLRKILLNTSTNFANGEAARTLAFTQDGSVTMQNSAGSKVATFSGASITNNVAPPGSMTVTQISNIGEDLTAAGYADYFDLQTWPNGSADSRKNGVNLIGGPSLTGGMTRVQGSQSSGQTRSWTDGTNPTSGNDQSGSGGAAAFFQAATLNTDKVTFSFPASTGSHRAKVLLGYMSDNAGRVMTIRFNLSDGSVAEQTQTITTVGFNSSWQEFQIDYTAASVCSLTISCESTSGTMGGSWCCVQVLTYQ
jgi:hypothetical protein